MGNQMARTAGRTSSTGPVDQRNDRWLTPLPIIEALTTKIGFPSFDLDPCGAPGHVTARRIYLLEDGDDGLRDPWAIDGDSQTRVFLNPPYGREKIKWVDRFLGFYESGGITGTMLVPYDPGQVAMWQERLYPKASSILAYRHRVNFVSRDPKRVGADSSGRSMVSVNDSAIVAFGQHDADALWMAVEQDLIPGFLTDYTTKRTR